LVRPPQGKLTLRKLLAAWKLGQTVVLWNVDPRDYRASPEERAEWAARYRPSAGDVVLLHDNRSASLDLLQRMRPALARIECGLIEDWLQPKEFNRHGRPSVEKRLQEVAR
jgi:peptidoglycan/xylan/chitin deacetylase (PgdA/CDA1 family)